MMHANINFEEARDMLLGITAPVSPEPQPLSKATGRILAQDIAAAHDVPPFSRSPYDGYAFLAADTADASKHTPVTLRILEEIPAGSMWTQAVTPGTASKILTGAPIPPGADAVIKFEDTDFTNSIVKIYSRFDSGDNVCFQGEDTKKGAAIAKAGDVIDAGLAGMLAAQDISDPLVYRQPRAAIITIGSELTADGEAANGAKIVNSNRYMLEAAILKAGAMPIFIGTPKDDAQVIGALMAQALDSCDIVITSGGVSVGDYDMTPAALEFIRAEVLIRNLRLKPGGMGIYGRKNGKLLCCLSGNPASSMTAFYAVVLPALRRLCGRSSALLPSLPVVLKQPFPKKSPSTRLLRGRLDLSTGTAQMDIGAQSNGMIGSMIGSNVFAVVPAGSPALEAGTALDAFLIE